MEDTRIGKSGKYFSGVIYTVGDETFFKDNLLKHDFLDDTNEPDLTTLRGIAKILGVSFECGYGFFACGMWRLV